MSTRFTQAAFTLVEILVVIVVIGIVLSVGILSLSNVGDTRALRTEGLRFASLIAVGHDEAAMQGREFGVEVLTAGYRFVEYDPYSGLWTDITGDDTFRLRALPDGMEFELYLEDREILLDNDPAPFENPDDDRGNINVETYAPHLLIYSSGDATPFELHLWRTFGDQRVIIKGDAIGAVELINEDDG